MIDRKWIGAELPSSTMVLERGRMRFFAQAIGETDPLYVDPQVAQRAGYADLPAPPTFLFSLDLDAGTLQAMLDMLEAPMEKVLHGEQKFRYYRAACAGDQLTVKSRVADIYDKKGGALEFIVKLSEISNQAGERVAELESIVVVRH